MYIGDYNGGLPGYWYGTNTKSSLVGGIGYLSGEGTLPNGEVTQGPISRYIGYKGLWMGSITNKGVRASFICPSYNPPPDIVTANLAKGWAANNYLVTTPLSTYIGNFKSPARTCIIGEIACADANGAYIGYADERAPDFRHSRSSNIAYADGHVGAVTPCRATGPGYPITTDVTEKGWRWKHVLWCYDTPRYFD